MKPERVLEIWESMTQYDDPITFAAAIEAALLEGKILVPVEPTEEMIARGAHVNSEWLNDNAPLGERMYRDPAKSVYKAMLQAAPKGGE